MISRTCRQYRAEKSRVCPGYHVFDFARGTVARKSDGSLAYFPTRSLARAWADNAEASCV